MNTNIEFHKNSGIIFTCLLILFSSTIFPQPYTTKYDTVDCSKYSCEQWGMKNGNCSDLDLEQWPAHCTSCGQLSLFLQDEFNELDYGIYLSVVSCTMWELECEFSKELGFIPNLSTRYQNPNESSEKTKYWESGHTYEVSSGWTGDTYVWNKIVIETDGDYGYSKIGSGHSNITQKINYVKNEDSVFAPMIGVAIRGDTPIATAQIIMSRFSSLLQSNYEMARSIIYDQLNNATNGWTEEEKQGAIRSIKWNYSDSRMRVDQCEEDYFGFEEKAEDGIIDETEAEEDVLMEEIPQQTDLIISEPEKVTTVIVKPLEIQSVKSNKLPIVNFEINTVSGGSFEAPVWIKYYPSGTYDPDGYIVLFEMDMDGDGEYDVQEKTLTGGSYEFTTPGNYTTTVRVTDDKGGVTTKSKSFTISDPDDIYAESPKVYKPVEEHKPADVELNKKLDSIIEEFRYQDELPTIATEELEIAYQEPKQKKVVVTPTLSQEKKETKIIETMNQEVNQPIESKNIKKEKIEAEPEITDVLENIGTNTKTSAQQQLIITDDSVIQLITDSYVYAYSYRNWNEANFGKHNIIAAGWHSTGGEKRIYMKFDLPLIDSEKIDRAVLKLYHNNTIGKNSHSLGIYKVLESWEEGYGTFHSEQSEPIDSTGAIIWDTQPIFDDSSYVQFKPKKKRNQSVEIDITALVKEWLKGTPNNGLLVKPPGQLSGRDPISIYEFYSREYEDKTKVPVIKLYFR